MLRLKAVFSENLVLLFIILFLAFLCFNQGFIALYNWDLFGHYIYLPLIFDQHNVQLSNLDYLNFINEQYQFSPTLYQFVKDPSGYFFTKYTIGWAILQTPFYLIAEIWANSSSYVSDGFSYPYKVMIHIGAFFYLSLGLYYTNKILKKYFETRIRNFTLILLVFGTNLFFMSYESTGSSHIFAFFLVALFLYRIDKYYDNPSLKNIFFVSLVLGLLTLTRPPDAIFGILFLAWKISSFNDLHSRLTWFLQHKKQLILFTFTFLFIIFPQFLYWHNCTGKWIINSYANNPGEGFDFFTPYTVEFLLSFRKGWFIYTPLILASFLGFLLTLKSEKNSALFLTVSLLFTVVISCWTTWWYASSFSARAAIDLYPILAFGFAFFLQKTIRFRQKILIYVLIFAFIVLNLFQSYQLSHGIIHDSRMTKAYYLSTFGQLKPPTEKQKSLLSFDFDRFYANNEIDFSNYKKIKTYSENLNVNRLAENKETYLYYTFLNINPFIKKSHVYIKVSYYFTDTTGVFSPIYTANLQHKDAAYAWRGYEKKDPNLFFDKKNNSISFNYITPNIRSKSDELSVGIWNREKKNLKIHKQIIEIFEPKKDYQ